jgi:GGDEF domain-containing protein
MFFHTGGDEFYVILPDATLKAEDAGMKDAFGNASDPKGAWKRVEDFIRSSRAILIEGVDMHGKSYSDHIHARIAVSDYGISSPKGRSLDKALNHIARQESALQQLTNLYVPSGRQSFTA